MKLVIKTQHKENYGAHDWDGKGECPQRWKFKGGETYVVENITPEQAIKSGMTIVPTLSALIECNNEAWEEYIIDWSLEDNDAKVCEDWETPVKLTCVHDCWFAVRTTQNDGIMRRELLAKREEWVLREGGERAMYQCEYMTENEVWLSNKQITGYLEELDAAA